MDETSIVSLDAYLKEWQETAKRVQAQMQKSLLEPIIHAQKEIQQAFKPTLEVQKKILESVLVPLQGLSQLAEQTTEFLKSLQGSIGPAFEQLQVILRELPASTQEALMLFGTHGWYLDMEMPLPWLWDLKKALLEGNAEEAEETLADYFNDRLEEIEKYITEKFPHRAQLIRAAFNAHRRQEYELSIPVLLAQTDGICKEVTKQYLFIKRAGKPQITAYIEQLASDTILAALLSPLTSTLPISASEQERSEDAYVLNRHTVLHGESLNYGSKTNSLKAISLINYVSQVLKPLSKNP